MTPTFVDVGAAFFAVFGGPNYPPHDSPTPPGETIMWIKINGVLQPVTGVVKSS